MEAIFDLENKNANQIKERFNQLPCFQGSGARITDISKNLDKVNIEIPLNNQTRNVLGTIYGGSMYSATDAIYMVMLWYALGKGYLLMDKASNVEYIRPGTNTITGEFNIDFKEIQDIRNDLSEKKATTRTYNIELVDNRGKVVCRITKTIYIRRM